MIPQKDGHALLIQVKEAAGGFTMCLFPWVCELLRPLIFHIAHCFGVNDLVTITSVDYHQAQLRGNWFGWSGFPKYISVISIYTVKN